MASKYGGYMGKIIELNLTTKTTREYPWTDRERELFIGGKIMAAKILSDNFTGKEDPLGEENIIVIATGPLTGTPAPSSSRFDISTLSPQTGILASSNCGGTFGYFMKKAGYDALIIKGKCSEHTWIDISNSTFNFYNADDMWGLRTTPTQEVLTDKYKELHGKKALFGKMCIGPGGENLVKYSSVISDERAAGRTGVGAVFGSKNIKAITISGNYEIPLYDEAKAKAWAKKWYKYLRKHPLTGNQLPRLGTAGLVSSMQMRGILATRNYKFGKYEHFDKVNGETMAEDFNIVNKGCMSCPIKCARTVNVGGKEVKGPELEILGLMGGGIMNDDLGKINQWNNDFDELGMDTISGASTIAWAMEANEKGIWKCGLNFGETDGISQLIDDIAHRRGIGDELAEGSRRLSKKYGGEDFAIQSKGLELAAYEPRRAVGHGLGYSVSNRGGCHINGGYLVILEGLGLNTDPLTPHAKADFTMMFQNLMECISGSGQCIFTSYAFFPGILITRPNGIITKTANAAIPYIGWAVRFMNRCPEAMAFHLPVFHHTKMIKYAVGMNMTFGKYMRIGERGFDTERYVNTRFGITSKDDALPKRLTDVPQDPNNPKTRVPLEQLKKTYYRARGWDKNGVPRKILLKSLKII